MIKDLKNTTKHTSIYALGNFATKIIGLILIPLYTRPEYLSTTDFGALSVLEATSQLLIGILSMGMGAGLTRWYWDKNYATQQKSIFFTSLVFLLVTILIITSCFTLFSSNVSALLFKSTDYSYLIKLTIIASGLQIITNHILTLAKLQSKSITFAVLQVVKLTLVLGLILWGIIHQGRGLEAIWEANIIGGGVALLLLIPYTLRNITLTINISILKKMLQYGLPLMLASVSSVILSTADRYMLSSMSGLEQTGVYALALRIANTLKVVITASLASSLAPIRMKKMGEPNNQRFYSKTNTYTLFIFGIGLLALSLFSLEILKQLTGAKLYWESNLVIPIIGFALFFGLLKDNLKIGLTIKKKTKIIGISIFITSIINIGLNLILIPILDIYGAAMATMLSQLIFLVLISTKSQKIYPIPYEWKKIFTLFVLLAISIGIGLHVADLTIWPRLLIKSALFLSFPFILYFLNFYDAIEIDSIKLIFKNWTNLSKTKDNFKRLLK